MAPFSMNTVTVFSIFIYITHSTTSALSTQALLCLVVVLVVPAATHMKRADTFFSVLLPLHLVILLMFFYYLFMSFFQKLKNMALWWKSPKFNACQISCYTVPCELWKDI